jgi:hypothetical protein
MNPAELSRRLDQRFRLLGGGDRVAIERHQTLRATIDWSYDLLSEPQRRLLARMAVFAGGCTLDAAEAVCAGDPIEADDVLELLAGLVARSLVVADTGPDTRYRLLETIRQYGEERLVETGDTDRLRARHADHYTDLTSTASREIWGPGQVEWGARLARERENLLAAMAFALNSHDVARAMRLLGEVPFFDHQIYDLVVFDPAPVLALPGAADHPGAARALMETAWNVLRSGDPRLALDLADQALETEQRLGPCPGYLQLDRWKLTLRAFVADDAGDMAESARLRLELADHDRAAGHPALAALALGESAGALAWVDTDAAVARANDGLALARRTGIPAAISHNLFALAETLAPSDPQRGATLLREAEAYSHENVTSLTLAVFAASRLEEWRIALRAASRLLHLDRRSGSLPLLNFAAILQFVARGLAGAEPTHAAVLQGAVRRLVRQHRPADPSRSTSSDGPNRFREFFTQLRGETTQLISAALGEPRLRELLSHGEAMDRDQASAYARTHIDELLASGADKPE